MPIKNSFFEGSPYRIFLILKTTEVFKTSVVCLYSDQSKSTTFPSSFHFAGTGVSIQSRGSPKGNVLATEAKYLRLQLGLALADPFVTTKSE